MTLTTKHPRQKKYLNGIKATFKSAHLFKKKRGKVGGFCVFWHDMRIETTNYNMTSNTVMVETGEEVRRIYRWNLSASRCGKTSIIPMPAKATGGKTAKQ